MFNLFTHKGQAVEQGGGGGSSATVTLESLGLDKVDNTADNAKPISAATQIALDKKADKTQVILNGVVATFADLPISATDGQLYLVKTATGVFAVNRKKKGLYLYESGVWIYTSGDIAGAYITELELAEKLTKINTLTPNLAADIDILLIDTREQEITLTGTGLDPSQSFNNLPSGINEILVSATTQQLVKRLSASTAIDIEQMTLSFAGHEKWQNARSVTLLVAASIELTADQAIISGKYYKVTENTPAGDALLTDYIGKIYQAIDSGIGDALDIKNSASLFGKAISDNSVFPGGVIDTYILDTLKDGVTFESTNNDAETVGRWVMPYFGDAFAYSSTSGYVSPFFADSSTRAVLFSTSASKNFGIQRFGFKSLTQEKLKINTIGFYGLGSSYSNGIPLLKIYISEDGADWQQQDTIEKQENSSSGVVNVQTNQEIVGNYIMLELQVVDNMYFDATNLSTMFRMSNLRLYYQ